MNPVRTIIAVLFLVITLTPLSAQRAEGIRWTEFADLADSLRREPRPLLVFIEADWCRYCRLQKATTFQDTTVVDLLNGRFYSLRLDAECREPIVFMGRTYSYVARGPSNGRHELAELFGRTAGNWSLPVTILLDKNRRIIQKWPGYIFTDLLISALYETI